MALRDLVAFWMLGQAVLVIGSRLFNWAAGYDVQGTLEADNLATGLSLAGFLVAVGIVVDASLTGAADRLLEEVAITLATSAIGLTLLLLTARIAGRIFLPHAQIAKEIATDRNPAAGILSAACFVAVAILLARAMTV